MEQGDGRCSAVAVVPVMADESTGTSVFAGTAAVLQSGPFVLVLGFGAELAIDFGGCLRTFVRDISPRFHRGKRT